MKQPKRIFSGKKFYHGTSDRAARRIARVGFQVGDVDVYADGDPILVGDGYFGVGTYVTTEWRTALFFGNVILRVDLKPGTKILDAEVSSDSSVLDHLKREFGKDILGTGSLHLVLPQNKRLTMPEAIALLRYHYARTKEWVWWAPGGRSKKTQRRDQKHAEAMHRLGRYLMRFGFSGFGDPEGEHGIVIFRPDRLRLTGVAAALSPEARLHVDTSWDCGRLQIESLEQLCEICRKFEDKDSKALQLAVLEALASGG